MPAETHLFAPISLRDVTVRNRIWVSPMCQYSSVDGFPTDWHLVHLGSRAVGGAGLVFTEATAVTSDGRISPQDAGIWTDEQGHSYARIAAAISAAGATPAMQLAHAGRKASTFAPWRGRGALPPGEAWPTMGASELGYADWPAPHALTAGEIGGIVEAFAAAARRALDAGFEVLEIHAAHGYLLHEFLSPLSNVRTDEYGGDLAGRGRFTREVLTAVRAEVGAGVPLSVRISASDWVPGGWDLEESVALAKELAALGADLIDCSSGGLDPRQQITVGPGYQVPFSRAVRSGAGVATGAVGEITSPVQAESILRDGDADVVLLARELLRDPYWPLRAADELGANGPWPVQYARAART